MAIRNLTLITKNANQPGKALPSPSNVEVGEGLVNTADGKLFFKGFISTTGGTSTFVESTLNSAYFEIGSHVSNLKIDNKIISYDGIGDLSGKILSGGTSGFSAVDISKLQDATDTYLTGASFDNSTEQLTLNVKGRPDVNVTLDDNVTTDATLVGSTIYFDTKDAASAYTVDLSALDVNDTYVTGGTYDNNNAQLTFNNNDGGSFTVDLSSLDLNDTFVTGGTLDNANEELTFTNNDGSTFSVDISSLDINDTFVTGTTWDSNNNELTLQRNEGASDITQTIDAFNSLDVTTLSAGTINTTLASGRVVYTDTNGQLKTDSGFEYDEGNSIFKAGNIETSASGSAKVGTGGLEVGSGGSYDTAGDGDVIIHGNLTIYGEATTASTSELYIEDHNFILNYNPDNDTSSSSLGAGFSVQDGLGVQGVTGDTVFFQIAQSGGTNPSTVEDAYSKRFWETDLINMALGSTGGTGTGYFVVKEDDTIDGGSY